MIFMEKLKHVFENRLAGVQDARGVYAVMVLLVARGGELHLLFELRSDKLKGQPGETCFPGGRLEEGELPVEAALRETWEEVGIPPEAIEIIAPLDIIQDISYRVIYPFLGYIPEDRPLGDLKVNSDEVKDVFLVPLSELRAQEPYCYTTPVVVEVGDDFAYEKIGFPNDYRWGSGKIDIPVYEHNGYKVWGMTGRTVRNLLRILEEEGL